MSRSLNDYERQKIQQVLNRAGCHLTAGGTCKEATEEFGQDTYYIMVDFGTATEKLSANMSKRLREILDTDQIYCNGNPLPSDETVQRGLEIQLDRLNHPELYQAKATTSPKKSRRKKFNHGHKDKNSRKGVLR